MRSLGVGCLAACAIAAFAGPRTGNALADSAAPVCAGTGLLATEAPTAGAVPEAAGPVLLGPDRAGTTLASASEPSSGLSAASVSLGVAGCVDAAGTPGGTALSTGAWSILGGAIRGASMRADLVPRPPDGSDWWLRAKIEGLVVEGKPVTLEPGDEIPVGNWGTLSPRPSPAALPAGAPLRWWRAALQLELTRSHAGFPAGTTFLIGWVAADRAPLPMAATEPPPRPTSTPGTTTTAPAKPPAPPPPAPPASSGAAKAPATTHRAAAKHAQSKHKAAKHKVAKHKAAKKAAKRTVRSSAGR